MDIWKEAHKALIDRGKTFKGVARELGMSKEYLRRILRGIEPGRKKRAEIAAALGWRKWPSDNGKRSR